MDKEYEGISSHEFMRGLEQLELQGVKLPKGRGELLTEVINNTNRLYQAQTHGIKNAPINTKELSRKTKKSKKKTDSQILRENMINANRELPKGTDAHHIVPAKENRPWARDYAAAARAILRRWGIPINHEANGVALPSCSKKPVDCLPDAYPHKPVHTKVYYLNIADQLAETSSREDCIETLREIGEELQDGTYPIR